MVVWLFLQFAKITHRESFKHTPICFKNSANSFCIFFLTNTPGWFQDDQIVESGISDFDKLFPAVLRTHFKKQEPKTVKFRNYEKFSSE